MKYFEKTLKVSAVNLRHVKRENPVYHSARWSRKPLEAGSRAVQFSDIHHWTVLIQFATFKPEGDYV